MRERRKTEKFKTDERARKYRSLKNTAPGTEEKDMTKLTVCIGSSCHLKGSRQVVEIFQDQIEKHGAKDKIELKGTFCMGKCREGVCVSLNDEFYSVSPETAREFFETKVLAGL